MVDANIEVQGVSIVVCCHNSAQRLPETLQHLLLLDPCEQNTPIEIVLVDNGSTDNTTYLAQTFWEENGSTYPMQIVKEGRLGLNNARIAGINASKYSTVIFCDDDNWLQSDYAKIAFDVMACHSNVGLLGGSSIGVFECEPPDWFHEISGAWALGESEYQGLLRGEGAFVRGAGMVIRRKAFVQLMNSGFEFIASDRKGVSLASGGDSELCMAIQTIGYELYFDGRLRLRHLIPSSRLTWGYTIRLWQGFGGGTIANDPYYFHKLEHQKIKNLIRINRLYQILRGGFVLCSKLGLLRKIDSMIGNIELLPIVSRYGRLKAIYELKGNYSNIVRRNMIWIKSITIDKGKNAIKL